MFSVMLRVAITFLTAPLIILIWRYPWEDLINFLEGVSSAESQNAVYLAQFGEWITMIVLFSLVLWTVHGFYVHRAATGVR